MPWVVSVLNEKGGVGKTTTTMSLAAVTAVKMKARVLVVDVDPQMGSSYKWAENAKELGNALPFQVVAETDATLLARMRTELLDYDIIFVDTPGSLENLKVVQTVVDNSDYVIMPMEPAYLATASLVETIQTVLSPARVFYKVLLNRVLTKSDCTESFEALEGAHVPYFRPFVRQYVAHSRAPRDGLVVTQYKGRDMKKAIADYEAVALEMFQDWRSIDAALAAEGA